MKASLTLDQASANRVFANIIRRLNRMKVDAAEFVSESGEKVFSASQNNVPVDEGELLASGSLEVDGLVATITYDADHAASVHEDLNVNHEFGEAKFLENEIRGILPRFRKSLAKRIKV